MKRFKGTALVLVALLLVVGILAGCAPKQAAKQKVIGIVLPTKDEPRWIQDETRFNDALKDTDYSAEIMFSQGDPAREKQNVETLIGQGIKVLILCAHDAVAAAASAEAARDAGVKVISYDRLILDTDAVDYYVTFDSVEVGRKQGQYLVDHASGQNNPLYLYAGALSDNNSFLFFQGAWEVLQPKIADGTFVIANSTKAEALKDKNSLTRDEIADIIGQITTNWDFNTAKNLAQANLSSAPKTLKGNVFILAPNDGTARSIADTFAADPDITSYVITGQDAEKPSVQYIIDGKQSMTVFKDVRVLVRDAINAAITYLEGGEPEATTTYNNGVKDVPSKPSEVQVVDKSNVREILIDSGYYSESDFTWPTE
ncbi:MAG TPA: sugar ABC transporter substrate-binding protein [Coprothermobacter proteolyticus]|uniref:sugar ABC transporter substrate-binding protein n=1 Tax=Coprothermobacter proteolyticus TaxID=35786 RepID=UPI000AD40875|nr:sugar-binding protein [Coprothermobacter proteolyticus]MBP8983464.1 sugar-binding protein [Coprothermobacter sp.]HOA65254.1 sugar ABC transporter substrate-binding protein [Coprothermobacter proteolyticus]HOP45913.1 sugar ABC transporter substrate-binding protein [Coprothermobacter proteolyticus]HPU70241.1 sugar ABC transporter substrate-binding protein [Coprothermobacter proteolyticus]HPZ45295.1 sugar ABC transporter substrate-binding protein [Coprothermobacter proteolyticus]